MMKDSAPASCFHADLIATLGRPLTDADGIALAVSGGPDSMAMLALGHAAFPDRIIAATFDHGLRPASADEAAMVAGWCATHAIPHATLRPDRPLSAANLQAEARTARYAALKRWAIAAGARILATAHHADDQAETFLMRANRGSGLAGLAGIRAARDDGDLAVIRPLLNWRRTDLRAVVEATGIPFVTDPSNTDARFDRARMRAFLAGQDTLSPDALARSAMWLGAAEADLRAAGEWLWTDRRRPADAGAAVVDVAGLPRALRRWLARIAIAEIRRASEITLPTFADSTPIEPLLESLDAGRSATQGGVLASPTGDLWHFRQAPPRRAP